MSTFRSKVQRAVRPYSKYISQLTKPVLRVLIQVSVHYIENSLTSPEVLDLALTKLTHLGHNIPENFCELFAAILQVMQIFLRTPKGFVKDHELKDVLKELRFSDECIEDLSKVLFTHRATLSLNHAEAKLVRPTARKVQWRINISLTEGIIHSKTPTIILHFQLPNGSSRTLELPLAMFHRLRYNVALLLSEMQALESRAVMKRF